MEPLVFLPGMMCDARLFAPQVTALSREMAVTVAPITMGERVEEMASALLGVLPAKFALAGLSMGGIVAMEILRSPLPVLHQFLAAWLAQSRCFFWLRLYRRSRWLLGLLSIFGCRFLDCL